MNFSKFNYQIVAFPIILMVVIFLLWSSLMKIGEFVRGSGKIIPASDTQKIQHLEGGIIADILIKEGQVINKGDIIYRISNEFARSELGDLQLQHNAILAKEARLNAELVNAEYIQFSNALYETVPDIVYAEQQLFDQRKVSYQKEVEVAENKVEVARLELTESRNKLKNLIIEREYAKEHSEISQKLSNTGAGSKVEYLRALRDYQRLVTEVDSLENRLPTLERTIYESEAILEGYKSDRSAKIQAELSDILLQKQRLKENIGANLDRVERTDIVSTVDGVVQTMYFKTIGGIVRPGEVIAEIIPMDENLVIEAKIRPEDRSKIWVGQEVLIKITAYDSAIFGKIAGKVDEISADTFVEDYTRREYYIVKVSSSEDFGVDRPLFPGMTAEVNIVTGKKTILSYIAKPIRRVFANSLIEP